jgi:hypothetical protein
MSVGNPTAAPERYARSQILKKLIMTNPSIRIISPRTAAMPNWRVEKPRKMENVFIIF